VAAANTSSAVFLTNSPACCAVVARGVPCGGFNSLVYTLFNDWAAGQPLAVLTVCYICIASRALWCCTSFYRLT
jgi:hypothetical protein